MKTQRERLQAIINEARNLLPMAVTDASPEFKAWKMKAERFLIDCFGKDSHEYSDFESYPFSPVLLGFSTTHSDFIDACRKDIQASIAVFTVYLEDLEETIIAETSGTILNYARIFIVHGHDGEMKQSVARIIEKQGIEAIILSEQANRGKTIIEKLEGNSDVGGAVCLFTADDDGKAKKEAELKSRARQNVVLEAGYFMGLLGRDHVVFLADNEIEMPSDLSGVVYTSTSNWEVELLKELKAMGYSIDFNRFFDKK